MTAPAVAAVQIREPVGRFLTGPFLPLALFFALVIVAFWRSFARVLPFAGAETAVGLVPFVPVLLFWLTWASVNQRLRRGQALTGVREPALDYPTGILLLLVAGWLVWQTPAVDGWYFWARRLDLLAAAAFIVGAIALVWGVQTLYWYRWCALYALFIWPDILIRLQDVVAPPLAIATALLARPLAIGFGASLAPVQNDLTVFVSSGPVQWGIIIGDVCSGLNAALAVLLVSIPAAAHLGLSFERGFTWICRGIALALLSNVVRVVILFLAVEAFGEPFGLRVLHPILGVVLLSIVFLIQWAYAPATEPVSRPSPFRAMSVLPLPSLRTAGVLLSICGIFFIASSRIEAFEPLPPIGPPGAGVTEPLDYVRLPDDWKRRGVTELAWQNLFGPSSRSFAMSFASSEGAIVKAQLVVTPDRGKLTAFSLEACRVYHGNNVIGRRTVDLGAGGVAYLIDTWDRSASGAGRLSVLYWETPLTLRGREANARFAIFVVENDQGILPPPRESGLAPGGEAFDAADNVLIQLARDITNEILSG